jgi:hypothetical protein
MFRSPRIAFPGHAFADTYSAMHTLVLLPSTADFEAATGIKFIAVVRDNYDSRNSCLTETGHGHLDDRHCPEPGFHRRMLGKCLPPAEWFGHYAGKP